MDRTSCPKSHWPFQQYNIPAPSLPPEPISGQFFISLKENVNGRNKQDPQTKTFPPAKRPVIIIIKELNYERFLSSDSHPTFTSNFLGEI
jgi:hypothetical protein